MRPGCPKLTSSRAVLGPGFRRDDAVEWGNELTLPAHLKTASTKSNTRWETLGGQWLEDGRR